MPLVVGVRVRVGVSEAVGVPRVGEGHRQRQRVEAGVRSVRLVPRIAVAGMGTREGRTTDGGGLTRAQARSRGVREGGRAGGRVGGKTGGGGRRPFSRVSALVRRREAAPRRLRRIERERERERERWVAGEGRERMWYLCGLAKRSLSPLFAGLLAPPNLR